MTNAFDIFALVAMLISIAAAVVSLYFSRRTNVRELENNVDEIATVIEKIARDSRSARMRRVREAALTPEVVEPPGLVKGQPELPNLSAPVSKDILRRMANGRAQ